MNLDWKSKFEEEKNWRLYKMGSQESLVSLPPVGTY